MDNIRAKRTEMVDSFITAMTRERPDVQQLKDGFSVLSYMLSSAVAERQVRRGW
jgi:hypothetical protein